MLVAGRLFFCCKNISKKIEKIYKNLLTSRKICVIIGHTRKEMKEKRYKKMKILKSILDYLIFSLTGKGKMAEEMVDKGLIDYSGQGRNKYGK